MKINRALLLLLLMVFWSTPAPASSPCGKSGWTGLRANDGRGYLFYVYRDAPDVYFAIPGEQVSFPDGPKSPRFFIDEILYQSLFVKPADFIKDDKELPDLEVLKRHATYEFDYMRKTPTPLRHFVELGPRVKPAANGQPSFTFYLWGAIDPDNQKGAHQFFLTTLSAGDVVVLSAIVRDEAADDRAIKALITYGNSFQHILKKENCPEKVK